MNKFNDLLTKGLSRGYGGEGKIENINRAGFVGEGGDFVDNNGDHYHDEWFANESGGGQELVQIGREKFTRLYGGGTLDYETFEKMDITEKDVGVYLKKKILELGNKTRLFEDCNPEADGDWKYTYKILESNPSFEITTGREFITYKNIDVHIHHFILCPVK